MLWDRYYPCQPRVSILEGDGCMTPAPEDGDEMGEMGGRWEGDGGDEGPRGTTRDKARWGG